MLALVTGASSGIGLQYATQLARDYHTDLLLVSNQEEEQKQVAADLAAQYGVTAIVQPGGSIRDEDSIKKANELGITMLFTGMRHFKH